MTRCTRARPRHAPRRARRGRWRRSHRRTARWRPERVQGVVGARTALGERHPDGLELLPEPARADADEQAPSREVVEGRELLGEDHGVALGQDQHAGGEAQGRGGRRQVREPDERVGQGRVLGAGHAARRGVGVGGLVAGGHDHVLDRPDRLEPGRLGRPRERHGGVGLCERADVGEGDAELHGCSSDSAGGPGRRTAGPTGDGVVAIGADPIRPVGRCRPHHPPTAASHPPAGGPRARRRSVTPGFRAAPVSGRVGRA